MKRSITKLLCLLLVLTMCLSAMPLALATDGETGGAGSAGDPANGNDTGDQETDGTDGEQGGDPTDTPPAPQPEFDPNAVTVELTGKQVSYDEDPTPAAAFTLPEDLPYTLTYAVTGGTSVDIDAGGKLHVEDLGESTVAATLRFTYGEQEYTKVSNVVTITVVDAVELLSDHNGSVALSSGQSTVVSYGLDGFYADTTGYGETYSVAVTSGEDTAAAAVTRTGVVMVTGLKKGTAQVTVTAAYGSGSVSKTLSDSFYVVVDSRMNMSVTLKSGVEGFDFADPNVFSSAKIDGTEVDARWDLAAMFRAVLPEPLSDAFVVLGGTNAADAGKLTFGTGFTGGDGMISDMEDVFFEKRSAGTTDISFEVYHDKLLILYGTLEIASAASDIRYETNNRTAVTFEEDDFAEYWNDYCGSNAALDYVIFKGQPYYGKLYTDIDKKTPVTRSMKFENRHSMGSTALDLDRVTYVPDGDKVNTYTDTLEFTAFGTNGDWVEGTVIITLNDAGFVSISSLGIAFGNANARLDDAIAEALLESKGKTLDYVCFHQPEAEDGILYYDFESSLGSYKILPTDRFYRKAVGDAMSLAKVCYVPAAGRSGIVEIGYAAVATDKTEHYGSVKINVTGKTKSTRFTDVNASSYAWAADSVDFLSYQQIVGGTNSAGTKYSPKNSITRGHFMLMLYRAFLQEDYGTYAVKENFSDIPAGTSASTRELYQAVGVAKALGIAKGSGGKYHPNTGITREEAMTLIYRTLQVVKLDLRYETYLTMTAFTDSSRVASYAVDAIDYLIDHGIVQGSGGKINPKSNITRAEMAVILHRVLTY